MGNAQVKTNFILGGRDRVSKLVGRANKGLDRMVGKLNKTSRASKRTGRSFGKNFGPKLIARLGAAAAAFASIQTVMSAVGKATEFSGELAKIQTLIGNQPERMKQLAEGIRAISAETGKSTTDIAGAVFETISAFGDSAETLDTVKTAAVGAAAGVAETAEATKLASIFMKNYGDMTAGAAQKALDLAFITNKLGQTTFEQLAQTMSGVVPIAAQLGVSQEELFAVYAALTGTTGDAAAVTTQLKSALFGLSDPAKGAGIKLKELGFASAEAAIAEKGLMGTLQAVVDPMNMTTGAVKELFGRKEAVLAILPLLSTQHAKYGKALDENTKAAGASAEALDAMKSGMGGLAHESKRASARMGDLLSAAGEDAGGTFSFFANQLFDLTDAFRAAAAEADKESEARVAAAEASIEANGVLAHVLGVTTHQVDQLGNAYDKAAEPTTFFGAEVHKVGVFMQKTQDEMVELMPLMDAWAVKINTINRLEGEKSALAQGFKVGAGRGAQQRTPTIDQGQTEGERKLAAKLAQARRAAARAAKEAETAELKAMEENAWAFKIAQLDSELQRESDQAAAKVEMHRKMVQDKLDAEMFLHSEKARLDAEKLQSAKKLAAQERVNAAIAVSSAHAALAGVESVIGANQVLAGIKAAMALGEGIYAVATKGFAGIPQLIAGVAAAAQFAIASGRPAPTSDFGGGATSPSQNVQPASGAGGGPTTTIVNLFGVTNTKAELGAELAVAKTAAEGTGLD